MIVDYEITVASFKSITITTKDTVNHSLMYNDFYDLLNQNASQNDRSIWPFLDYARKIPSYIVFRNVKI